MDHVSDLLSILQVEVEEHLKLIASAIPRFAQEMSHFDEDKEYLCDSSYLVEDLTALISLLHRRSVNGTRKALGTQLEMS